MYYLDTGIWLDFFENRNEPNLPKGDWAHRLIETAVKNGWRIIYSDLVLKELQHVGYTQTELNEMFSSIRAILVLTIATDKQIRRAKDISARRKIPKADALHSLIAKDHKAIIVTLDRHFKQIRYVRVRRPQDII
jgi:predicted nucleic acid-binding protein